MPEPSPSPPIPSTGTVLTTPPEPAGAGTLAAAPPAPPPDVAPSPQVAGRYRPLRPLGKGGLGEVFVALDGELNREVALKEVQARHLGSPDTLARFLREAEVTGHLEHPGVVPVYGLGVHADGRPYYAMRLIRGDSLQQALERFHQDGRTAPGERSVAFRGLLRRFVDVCNAVAYAHARGVIHRDLKPANVMLGPYGETLVIDWGLAKQIGRPEDAAASSEESVRLSAQAEGAGQTQPGSVAGTPAYMSPEQAAGQVEGLTPASDVYALGAVLYALLAGRPAFGGKDLLNLLLDVRLGAFAAPRQVNRSAPAALEAVCLKAMALKPEARYGSARDLAADVERWLADEPVSAYREPWSVRLGRWARRFRTLVTSLGVLLLTLTAALAVGLVLVNRERERAEQAEGQTRLALEQVTQEQGKTQRALDRSETAEKSASKQRQLALKTLRRVLDEIHDRLKDQPNQQELRKDLLQGALAGLKEVARAADTAEADHETIWALVELGDLFGKIEIGGLAEARKQYELAHELARKLAEADPGSAQAQRDLSISLSKLGNVQLEQGDSKAALASYQEALGAFRKLAKADPRSAQAQRDLAVSLSKLGDVQLEQGDGRAALASFQEALKISRKLAEADPGSAPAQRDLSVFLEQIGDVQLEQGDGKGALASYQEALGVARKLAEADPRSAQARRDLGASLGRLGDVQLEQGDVKGALASYQEALGLCRKLAEADPRSATAQRDLFVYLEQTGDAQRKQGDGKGALASYQEALGVARKLAKADPGSATAQRDLSASLERLGDVQREQGDGKGALASYQEALGLRRKLAEADPRSATAQRDLLASYSKLGNLAQQSSDFRQAADWYAKGREVAHGFAKPEVLSFYDKDLGRRVEFCRSAEQALDDLASLDKQPAAERLELLAAVHRALVQRKERDKAVQAAEKFAGSAEKPGEVYNAACAFALCVPLADKEAAREKLASRAVELLKQALAKGFKDAALLKKDPDLDPLRQRDDFQKLLAEVEKSQPEAKP
jgi:tetratricopeptide (TPR) repeat protein